jgi:hypothetical protein
MTAQLSAGMRGMECVYRAVGTLLRDFQDPPTPAAFPAGWAPDMAAFRAGLDMSTRELTDADRKALEAWYQTTIGEVPRWVTFFAKYYPQFLKAYRLKWEAAFRGALPKQMMPLLMLRHSILMAYPAGIREAALLGKAWGVSRDWLVSTVACSAYYHGGPSSLSLAEEALSDVFDTWDRA